MDIEERQALASVIAGLGDLVLRLITGYGMFGYFGISLINFGIMLWVIRLWNKRSNGRIKKC